MLLTLLFISSCYDDGCQRNNKGAEAKQKAMEKMQNDCCQKLGRSRSVFLNVIDMELNIHWVLSRNFKYTQKLFYSTRHVNTLHHNILGVASGEWVLNINTSLHCLAWWWCCHCDKHNEYFNGSLYFPIWADTPHTNCSLPLCYYSIIHNTTTIKRL